MARSAGERPNEVRHNLGRIPVLILGVFAVSLLLAAILQGAPLLSAWYSASGVLIAAGGSVAVLSLIQSERQEAERNDRESARLTLEKCEKLAPVLGELEAMHETSARSAALAPMQDGWNSAYSLQAVELERLLRDTAPTWVHDYDARVRLKPNSLVDLSDRKPRPEELRKRTDKAVAERLKAIRGDLSQAEPQLSAALGTINLLAAYILEAKCKPELAKRAIGERCVAALDPLRPLLAADDCAEHYPFLVELYDAFQ